MEGINDRFRELRQSSGLSQEAFGARLGMSRSEVKNIEYGVTTLKDKSVPLICREFDVNEQWLRTGEGDMFVIRNRNAQIMSFVGDAMKGEESNFQRRLLLMLSKLTVEEWELIERKMRELMGDE